MVELRSPTPQRRGDSLKIYKMHYVYILKSQKDKRLYIGYSNNLKLRIKEHNLGKVVSTKNRRPSMLIGYEAYINKKDAIDRERYLKSGGKAHNDLSMRFKNTLGL